MMKRIFITLATILTVCIAMLICSCDVGDSGNPNKPQGGISGNDPGTSQGGGDSESEKGSLVSASLSANGRITLKLSNGKTEELGTASYINGGTLNISYDSKMAEEYGIVGFESLGDGRLAIKTASVKIECSGALVCSHLYEEDFELVSSTCTEKVYVRKCAACGASDEKTEEYDGHVKVVHPEIAASCKAEGNKAYETCENCDYTTYEPIPKLKHTPIADKGYPATDSDYGLTDGSHCIVCETVLEEQKIIFPTGFTMLDNYSGDYGYDYLGGLERGDKLQAFYLAIDSVCDEFHLSETTLGDNILETFTLADYGIGLAEAGAVLKTYKADNPLYYWISSTVSYTEKDFSVLVGDEYLSADIRLEYNKAVFNAVKDYLLKASGYTSTYELTLAIHDEIIKNVNYAYQSDGVTPSSAASAHNVLGVFVFGEGVCESYAKTFQLILNYCNVENLLVTGYGVSGASSEGHAWNLVRLDDGEYYWYDLTWDDAPGYMDGVIYNYFAVDDDTPLGWRDYGWQSAENKSFAESHIFAATEIGNTVESGLAFEYDIPARAENSIPLSDLRIAFSIDGIDYVRYGFDKVQAVGLPVGEVTLPETVDYLGRTYKVSSVGSVDGNSIFGTQSVSMGLTTLFISKNVEYIADGALGISTLSKITVDDENPFFTDYDGVLFTKNMVTLIKYPEAKTGSIYTIPDTVLYVSFGAMNNLGSLTEIRVGINLRVFGYASLGYAYIDSSDPTVEPVTQRIIADELARIAYGMASGGEISIDENNPNFD